MKQPFIYYSHLYAFSSVLKDMLKVMQADKEYRQSFFYTLMSKNKSYYAKYTEQEWLKVQYCLKQIVSLAGKNRKVYVFTIPYDDDFVRYKKSGTKTPALSRRFEKMASEVGFKYFDLLPSMLEADKDFQKYYFSCDKHWTSYGHEVAAKILAEQFLSY